MSRWVFSLIANLCACGGASEEVTTAAAPPPCSFEHLSAFDPGAAVLERQVLPPMQQRLGEETTLIATVACEEAEDDAACLERGEGELSAAYPGARVAAYLAADRVEVRARLRRDGQQSEERSFPTLEAVAAHLAARAARGEKVELMSATAVAAKGAKRHAVVHATSAPRRGDRSMLRMSLRLDVPSDPVRALLEVQERARAATITIHLVTPRDDGTIAIEIGCVAPTSP